jgi:hypothetical protein
MGDGPDAVLRHGRYNSARLTERGVVPERTDARGPSWRFIACHSASMECHRRAMIGEQTFEGRRENPSQANKLSLTCATLLECLNRHRRQGVTESHGRARSLHAGGQAVVGTAETPGGGVVRKSEEQPHANCPCTRLPAASTNPPRDPVPVAGDAERPMPNARRKVTGGAEGE